MKAPGSLTCSARMIQASFSETMAADGPPISSHDFTNPGLANANILLCSDYGRISVGGGKWLPYYFDDSSEGKPENILLHIL